MPETDQDVLNWAKSSIIEHLEAKSGGEVEWSNTDLLKLCMLVSLEETASDGSLGDDVLFKSTWDLSLIKHYSIRIRELFMDMCQDIEGDLYSKAQSSYDDYVAKYPTHLVSAINEVLYEQQGYKRMASYGDVSSFQLRRVLDSGVGSPILLAIIYMIVAEESGLSLHALSLEEGSYVVMWPKDDTIRLGAQGEVFVIDPYAKGSLMSAQEISEIFDVDVPFRPDSLKDMAEDTLLQLLLTHWCLAVQCPPEPLLAIPLDLDVALGEYSDVSVQVEYDDGQKGPLLSNRGDFWTVSPETQHHMQKCLSAAEKLHILQEGTIESTVRLALCQYFCQEYHKAIESLDMVLQLCESMSTKTEELDDMVLKVDPETLTVQELMSRVSQESKWAPVDSLLRLDGFEDPWERAIYKGRELKMDSVLKDAGVTSGEDAIVTVRRVLLADGWKIAADGEEDDSESDEENF
ncbi:hypothetical protein M9435_006683 [Picochlorum sp. BPE23]|nr:hypothetical protein M9435_006683 [Picochlorum sp. BPE23]